VAKPEIKKRAISLRRQGKSLGYIARVLNISKGTASYWCSDVNLSSEQKRALQEVQHEARSVALRNYFKKLARIRKDKHLIHEKEAQDDVRRFSQRDLLFVGLGLYWGEGYKKGNEELGFTNSDPVAILLYVKWLQKCYTVKTEDLILRLSINSLHTDRLPSVLRYWSLLLNIPLTQFTKSSLINVPARKKFLNHDEYYGTLRIKVRKGAGLRQRILASIKLLSTL